MSNMLVSLLLLIRDNLPIVILSAVILLLIMSISLAVIFKKLGQKFWKGLIPIYNLIVLFAILDIPIWMLLLLFVPFVNIFGIPILMIIVGDKLGRKCRRGAVFKLGLMLIPILFIPILAMCDIGEHKVFDAKKIQVVQVKEEFKLDPVVIADSVEVPNAMSLSDLENMNKLTDIKVKAKQNVETKKGMTVKEREEHLKKADKDRPTAKDLTFDYDLIYNTSSAPPIVEEEEPISEYKPLTIVEPIVKSKSEAVQEITHESDIKVAGIPEIVEPVIEPIPEIVEEVKPVIHDIVLEEAAPIDESTIGVIPINRRYDKQGREVKTESAKEVPKVEDIIITNIPAPETFANIEIPQVAAAPDFSQPVVTPEVPVENEEIVENTQYEQMVSMQIEEPNQLPVGVLVIEQPAEPEIAVEERTPFINIPASIEQHQEDYSDIQLYANPADIFQTGGSNESILRPLAAQPQAQIDKLCPKCGVKLKRDSVVCFMCGYSF